MKNKMIDLHNALFAELERLQDDDSYKNEDGTLNKDMVEAACLRADKVVSVSDKIMDLQRLQLQTVTTAYKMGYKPKMPETLGIEEASSERCR